MDVLITAARLFDGTGAPPLEDAAVVVADGRIKTVGARADLAASASAARRVDYGDCTLLPGLIDSHVHLAFSASPQPLRDLLSEDDRYLLLRAVQGAQLALRAGVTTVKDLGDRGGVALSLRKAIADGLLPGARVITSGPAITITGGHCYWLGGEADTADELRRKARELAKEGVDLIKVMASGGRMTPTSDVTASQYEPEQLRALVEESHRLHRTVVAHCHAAMSVRDAVAAEVDVIEHGSWISHEAGDRVAFDEDVARQMAAQGTYLDPTLSTQASFMGLDTEQLTPGQRELRTARPRVLAAHRRSIELGVPIAAGTDAGATRVPLDSLPGELVLLQELLGLSPTEAIVAATLNGARSTRLEHELGTLRPGRRADLLLVEGNPLEDLADLRRVRAVYKDGVLEVENGRLIRS